MQHLAIFYYLSSTSFSFYKFGFHFILRRTALHLFLKCTLPLLLLFKFCLRFLIPFLPLLSLSFSLKVEKNILSCCAYWACWTDALWVFETKIKFNDGQKSLSFVLSPVKKIHFQLEWLQKNEIHYKSLWKENHIFLFLNPPDLTTAAAFWEWLFIPLLC